MTDIPVASLPAGLRHLYGRNNNLSFLLPVDRCRLPVKHRRDLFVPRRCNLPFPRAVDPSGCPRKRVWRSPVPLTQIDGKSCDSAPRTISNLISDQTEANPRAASLSNVTDPRTGGLGADALIIPNTAPAAGAPPTSSMFAFFGQFFDHGLDLVGKKSNELVFVPATDPTDVLNGVGPGIMLNRADRDGDSTFLTTTAGVNRTTPWVDQNQTYASHPSKQVFIREYTAAGPVRVHRQAPVSGRCRRRHRDLG